MFISFISINVPKSSPTVCLRSGQSAYLLRYECLDFDETLLVLDMETEREIEMEYICQNNVYV